jgi:hypothetical protein
MCLVDEPKSGAIWYVYFLSAPLKPDILLDTRDIAKLMDDPEDLYLVWPKARWPFDHHQWRRALAPASGHHPFVIYGKGRLMGYAALRAKGIRHVYSVNFLRAVMQNSIDITAVYRASIFVPLKEAENIAPGVNPGDSIPRTHKLRRSGTDAFNHTNILDHNRRHVCSATPSELI